MSETQTAFKTEFKSVNEQTSTAQRTVQFTVSADFEMSPQSVMLLMKGALAAHELPFKGNARNILDTVMKINKAFMTIQDEEIIRIPVLGGDVQIMREFLEAYLADQEAKRAETLRELADRSGNTGVILENVNDALQGKFATDNYILCRLLLLDIREWQLGRVNFVD